MHKHLFVPLPIQQWRRAFFLVSPLGWHLPPGRDFLGPGHEIQTPNCAPPGQNKSNKLFSGIIVQETKGCKIFNSTTEDENRPVSAHQSYICIESFFIKQLYLICHLFTVNYRRSLIKYASQQGALWPSLGGSLIGWTGFSAFFKSAWMMQQIHGATIYTNEYLQSGVLLSWLTEARFKAFGKKNIALMLCVFSSIKTII